MNKLIAIFISLAIGSGAYSQMSVGGHSGGGYASGGEQPAQVTAIDLKVLLEGPYNGTDMNTDLSSQGLIPAVQVFDSDASAPWYYNGTEEIDPSASLSNTVNWVLLELRTTSGGAAAAISTEMRARVPALLQKDGTVTALDAESAARFNYEDDKNVYIVVWSQNHLPVMNATALSEVDGLHSYDFSDAQSKAWQKSGLTRPAMKALGGGMYGMYAGDCVPDTLLHYEGSDNDRDQIWTKVGAATVSNIVPGYHIEDLNMDGQVKYMGKDNDKNVIYNAMGGILNDTIRAHVPE